MFKVSALVLVAVVAVASAAPFQASADNGFGGLVLPASAYEPKAEDHAHHAEKKHHQRHHKDHDEEPEMGNDMPQDKMIDATLLVDRVEVSDESPDESVEESSEESEESPDESAEESQEESVEESPEDSFPVRDYIKEDSDSDSDSDSDEDFDDKVEGCARKAYHWFRHQPFIARVALAAGFSFVTLLLAYMAYVGFCRLFFAPKSSTRVVNLDGVKLHYEMLPTERTVGVASKKMPVF